MDNYTLNNKSSISVFPSDKESSIVIYLHGGGLIYGSRSDIPSPLIDTFNSNGITVISIDYLLAPNSHLDDILFELYTSYKEIKSTYIKELPYWLCGRSSGAFLMLQLMAYISSENLTFPLGLINFYGYYDLDFYLNRANKKTNKIKLSKEDIQNLLTDPKIKVWDDPSMSRFPLYIYALQEKLSLEYLGVNESNITNYELNEGILSNFPPVFSTASTSDKEVPFTYSKQLYRIVKNSHFVPVYYLEHDFLSLSNETEVEKVYNQLDKWITIHNII